LSIGGAYNQTGGEMQTELTREDVKTLYEFAVTTMRGGNLPYAMQLFERVAQSRQAFYTPFALSSLAEVYRKLRIGDLELGTLKRIMELPEEQKLLLDPRWLASCYQKLGDLRAARSLLADLLKLTPDDLAILGGLAEVSLLEGNLAEAEKLAGRLVQIGGPTYQILGRVIRAFSFELRDRHQESASELNGIGQYLISLGSIPIETWDYRDVQALLGKMGPNAKTAMLLMDVLGNRVTLQEFARIWTETTTPVVA
jgi:tetratricopeptide (TPR) repeat protein